MSVDLVNEQDGFRGSIGFHKRVTNGQICMLLFESAHSEGTFEAA